MYIQQNIPLASFTTYGIGGPADFFIVAESIIELKEAIKYAKDKQLNFFVLGTGANILIGDKGYRGLIIKNDADNFKIDRYELITESGTTIESLIRYSADLGLSGLEHYAGIPSSVGGALWQNLHFLSPDRKKTLFIGEILEKAVIFTAEGRETEVSQDYFKFDYDYSILHDRKDIVLTATFKLMQKSKKEVENTIASNLLWRMEKHPENSVKTSAGSVFRKIEGYGAGRLIEKVGLKGKQIGGAMVSPKHTNFIINTGKATARDVRTLITYIQNKVYSELHLRLEPEISFVGEF